MPQITAADALRHSSELAFSELWAIVEKVDEPQSWAVVTAREGEFLNSNGTIIGIVQHIAACKYLYGSFAFRNEEMRGRNLFERMKQVNTDWEASKQWLQESQEYWTSGWSNLTDEDLEKPFGTIWANTRPAWWLISRVLQHDQYHAGQIQLIATIAAPSSKPPDMQFDIEEKYASESPSW